MPSATAGIGVIVHNWPCSMLREEQHTAHRLHSLARYTCMVGDGAEVATLSRPPSLLPFLPSLILCAIWKLHAKCGGTHHREREGGTLLLQGGRNNRQHSRPQSHDPHRGNCLLHRGLRRNAPCYFADVIEILNGLGKIQTIQSPEPKGTKCLWTWPSGKSRVHGLRVEEEGEGKGGDG